MQQEAANVVVDMDQRGSLVISLIVLDSQPKQTFQGIHV